MADIHPMNFGEILDGSLTIYRRNFGLFLKLAVIVLAVPLLLLVFLAARFLGGVKTGVPNVGGLLAFFPAALLYYLATLVVTAGTIRIISDTYLAQAPRLGEALAMGFSKLGGLVAVALGKGVLAFFMMLAVGMVSAIAIPLARGSELMVQVLLGAALVTGSSWLCAFVLSGYGVTTPVVVLEGLGSAFDAFGRSWQLTRNRKLKVLGLWLVAVLVFNAIPSWALQGFSAVLRSSLPAVAATLGVLAAVVPTLLTPIVSAVITLIYYDLRVRREAFDLQVLGRRLGIA